MKKYVSFLLALMMLMGLSSCFSFLSTTTTTTTTIPGGYEGDPDELDLFYELFDPKNHIKLYLDISDSELAKIQADYEHYSSFGSKSPIYRMADLYVIITKPDGTRLEHTVEQVGVRMKGNTSRTNFYSEEEGMYNIIHFKISFGETFDEEEYYGDEALVWENDDEREARKDRTFATLEKMDIRWNKNDDATYIREMYAYDVFREFGVLAPHTNLASVDIGDDHAGVYLIYEPVDKIFLEKNLPEEALGGDLYKLGWASEGATFSSLSSYGVEDEDAGKFYAYDLKTNKKKSDHSSLINLILTLKLGSCDKEKFASVVDVENFLAYAAVSYMMGNPDDLRNNYNNSYVYFRKDNGKMMVIPYDADRGLGVNKDWNPYGDHMTGDSPFQTNNCCGEQKSPLFKKSILPGGYFVEEYIEALKTVSSNSIFSPEEFERRYEIAKDLYENDTTPSRTYYNAGNHFFGFDVNRSDNSNLSFRNYIPAKQATLARYLSSSNPTNPTPEEKWNLYLRGNFYDNNWSNQEKYKFMPLGDGVYYVNISIEVKGNDIVKFKVYNNDTDEWYNTVDESCSDLFVYQGDHRNVQFLKTGFYTIYFDTKTMTISMEVK